MGPEARFLLKLVPPVHVIMHRPHGPKSARSFSRFSLFRLCHLLSEEFFHLHIFAYGVLHQTCITLSRHQNCDVLLGVPKYPVPPFISSTDMTVVSSADETAQVRDPTVAFMADPTVASSFKSTDAPFSFANAFRRFYFLIVCALSAHDAPGGAHNQHNAHTMLTMHATVSRRPLDSPNIDSTSRVTLG